MTETVDQVDTVIDSVHHPDRASTHDLPATRSWVVAWGLPALLVVAGVVISVVGWWSRRSSTIRIGGGLIAVGAAAAPVALLLTGRLSRLVRSQVLLLVAVFAQTVQLSQQLVQFAQVRRDNMPLPRVTGITSLLNAEWLAMVWLMLMAAALIGAWRFGVRSRLLIAAAAWTSLHGLEHFYLLVQFARVTTALDNFGLARSRSISMLPGVLGRDGWLALHAATLRPWLGPLLAAPRVSVHLAWAIGDLALPLAAVATVAWRRRSTGTRPSVDARVPRTATAAMSGSASPG